MTRSQLLERRGLSQNPPDRLLPRRLRLRLFRDPGVEGGFLGRIEAQADGAANAGLPADFEDEYDDWVGALCEALRRLWRTPAPNLRALALKIDLAIEHEVGTLSGGEACLAAIRDDAQRLAAAYPGL